MEGITSVRLSDGISCMILTPKATEGRVPLDGLRLMIKYYRLGFEDFVLKTYIASSIGVPMHMRRHATHVADQPS